MRRLFAAAICLCVFATLALAQQQPAAQPLEKRRVKPLRAEADALASYQEQMRLLQERWQQVLSDAAERVHLAKDERIGWDAAKAELVVYGAPEPAATSSAATGRSDDKGKP